MEMEASLSGSVTDVTPMRRKDKLDSTLCPILIALCKAVSPGVTPSRWDCRRVMGVEPATAAGSSCPDKEEIALAFRRRMSTHALVYLARHEFSCPKLEQYNFCISPPYGVFSAELDPMIQRLNVAEQSAGMWWDADGKFTALVAEHGPDPDWMCIAATICMLHYTMRGWELSPSRNDLLEEVHLECNVFSRKHMSQVYEDLGQYGLPGSTHTSNVYKDVRLSCASHKFR